jgi:hypothetical protein
MEIRKIGVLGCGLMGSGIALTLIPFFLPISWRQISQIFHRPMLLVDRPHNGWLPLNPGERVITLLLINAVGWALSLFVVWASGRMLLHKSDVLVRN